MASGTTPSQDLTFVSTAELIDELKKRHDALVVVGIRFNSESGYAVTRMHHGNRHICIGLMSNTEAMLNALENGQLRYSSEDNA